MAARKDYDPAIVSTGSGESGPRWSTAGTADRSLEAIAERTRNALLAAGSSDG